MKTVKKLLTLLLAVTMLCALCACDEITHEDLNGEWTLSATPTAMEMDQLFPFGGFEYNEKLVIKAVFKDGTLDLHTDGMAKWVENMVDTLYQWIAEGDNIYDFFASANDIDADIYKADCAAAGISKEQLLQQFTSEITKEQMVKELSDSLSNSKTISHTFEINGNQLTFDEGATWTVNVSENKIVVTQIKNKKGTLQIENEGMVFTK